MTPVVERVARGVPYIDYLPDDSAQALVHMPALANPCVDCAFTAGTTANQHPLTSRLARECAESRCAFLCHMVTDSWGDSTHLCAGWVAALNGEPSDG